MTPEQTEQLRIKLLHMLLLAKPYSLPELELYFGSMRAGFGDITLRDVQCEIQYLESAKLLEKEIKRISRDVRKWKLTFEGEEYLAEQGIRRGGH